ncbi:MAG: hypothetical protein K2Y21_06795 [Phycisphaerales bacterium]|nr:hypothetical protein [Phycisphaerales bacterium]
MPMVAPNPRTKPTSHGTTSRSPASRSPASPRSARKWWTPLALPLIISAFVHASVVVALIAFDAFPGAPGRVAIHNSDDVTTALHLAPSPVPEPPPEVKPEPVPEPAPIAAAEPAPTPAAAVEPAPEISTTVVFEQPVAPPKPVAPARPAPAAEPTPTVSTPAPVAQAPMAGFAGVNVQVARRVVYAVDVSGAMAQCLDTVLLELRRSIGRLDSDQQFQVVFFREDLSGATRVAAIDDASGKATLLSATPESKRRVDQLLRSARPSGRSAPAVGLKRALEFGPDVIFLLTSNIRRTDAGQADNTRVLRMLEDLNPKSRITGRRAVVIKTLQFVEDDPTGLMQAIADAHGDGPGSYTLLKIADIERAVR